MRKRSNKETNNKDKQYGNKWIYGTCGENEKTT